jgi:hypothetical protein
MTLRSVLLDALTIEDEASFAHVAVYAQLKRVLLRSSHKFYVPAQGAQLSWDRAVFLNLTYWSSEESADVLCDDRIAADVVAHVAWHHLVAARLGHDTASPQSGAQALLFAESIASAFDLYLVGRLLRHVPDSDFIATQVSIMSEAAEQAGLSLEDFATLLDAVVEDPERAFEDMRALLFDASRALLGCRDALLAQQVLERYVGHRFEPLLHHYQLSNWVLYARAYAAPAPDQDQGVQHIDTALRGAPVSLDWLIENWLNER